MKPFATRRAGRCRAALAALVILGACAHTTPADDAELAGTWEGTATIEGRNEVQTYALRLELDVARGQVRGTGELIPPGGFHREGRHLDVDGEFQGRRAILRVTPEGLRPHALRVRLTEPDRLEGSLTVDIPGGRIVSPGSMGPMRVILTRTAP
jgi:hypothetical protein